MKLEWTKNMTKRALTYIVSGAGILLIYFLLASRRELSGAFDYALALLRPFSIAFIIAYILNGPMMFFEKRFSFIEKKRPLPALKRVLSIVAAWISAVAVFALFFAIIIPDVSESINTLVGNIPGYYEELKTFVLEIAEKYELETEAIDPLLNFKITADGIMELVKRYSSQLLPQIANIANISVKIGSFVMDFVLAIIISVYFMFSKETLIAQLKKALYAVFGKKFTGGAVRVARESHRIFSGFINGKLLDSLIMGILCFIGTSIFGFEYSLLISFIVGVTNIIPFFGPFIGAVPCVLILLMVDFWQAFWFAIFVFALQQLDGNVIGPKILGDSTGLPALWVMAAIIIGGDMFGIIGMFIGVPVFAVIYKFAKEIFEHLLNRKNMPQETDAYKVIKGEKDQDEIEKGENAL